MVNRILHRVLTVLVEGLFSHGLEVKSNLMIGLSLYWLVYSTHTKKVWLIDWYKLAEFRSSNISW